MTPIGRRSVNAILPSPASDAPMGTTSPASLRASTAAKVYVETAREASTRAVLIGLPASAQIVGAMSSCRSRKRPATRSRIAARSCAGSGRLECARSRVDRLPWRRRRRTSARGRRPRRCTGSEPRSTLRSSSPYAPPVLSVTISASTWQRTRGRRRDVAGLRPHDRASGRARPRRHRDDRLDAGARRGVAPDRRTRYRTSSSSRVAVVVNTHCTSTTAAATGSSRACRSTCSGRELEDARTQDDYTIREWVDFPGATYVEHDGEAEILPGVRLVPAPGDTRGHQIVVVETDEGTVVLGGDVGYSFREIGQGRHARASGSCSSSPRRRTSRTPASRTSRARTTSATPTRPGSAP